MRGSPDPKDDLTLAPGIIPAHAGLTGCRLAGKYAPGDHPRACGAHQDMMERIERGEGSSPRMRGSLDVAETRRDALGIIPAHAGLTPQVVHSVRSTGDHPRACGAHKLLVDLHLLAQGSSPRMRGSRLQKYWMSFLPGIIPAHAGLTAPAHATQGSARDHPRACGAHYYSKFAKNSFLGSSPRMRGSRWCLQLLVQIHGIIPAHAGLTVLLRGITTARRDHPRACGAHVSAQVFIRLFWGSSPRMRGSPKRSALGLASPGIIPAHAGLTAGTPKPAHANGDHPRACGAHTIRRVDDISKTGSSPRMRGSLEKPLFI